MSSTAWIYHERQAAALCGQHCLNNLLQGPYFSAGGLAEIAHELDSKERALMLEAGVNTTDAIKFLAEDSGNVDESGNFSIGVLRTAIQRSHSLQLTPSQSPEIVSKMADPSVSGQAFVCNLAEHWYTILKVGETWWNLNSTLQAPEQISAFYLSAFLSQLTASGYSLFWVEGQLPQPMRDSSMTGGGDWYKADELLAAAAQKQQARATGSGEWWHAAGGGHTLGGGGTVVDLSGAGGEEEDDLARALQMSREDDDLAKALALSMEQQGNGSGGGTTASTSSSAVSSDWQTEPAPNDPTSIRVQVRFPAGDSTVRRFRRTDPAAYLFEYIASCVTAAPGGFDVISGHTRLERDALAQSGGTFESLDMVPSASVRVRLR